VERATGAAAVLLRIAYGAVTPAVLSLLAFGLIFSALASFAGVSHQAPAAFAQQVGTVSLRVCKQGTGALLGQTVTILFTETTEQGFREVPIDVTVVDECAPTNFAIQTASLRLIRS
jgi:hypothetical protein